MTQRAKPNVVPSPPCLYPSPIIFTSSTPPDSYSLSLRTRSGRRLLKASAPLASIVYEELGEEEEQDEAGSPPVAAAALAPHDGDEREIAVHLEEMGSGRSRSDGGSGGGSEVRVDGARNNTRGGWM